jgi:subtilisin-like proprotein convertase family protein
MIRKLSVLGGFVVLAMLATAIIAAPAGAKTKTKTLSNATPVPIPDASPPPNSVPGAVFDDIGIGKKGTVKDIKVGVQITHTDTGDLELWLLKDTQPVPLSFNNSGPGADDDNYGSGTGCVGGMTVFDGAAALQLFDSTNPFDGSFRPDQNSLPLGVYNGEQVKGTWRLLVVDDAPVDTGTITCFQLTAKYKVQK